MQSKSTPKPPRLAIDDSEGYTHVTFPQHQIDGHAVRELYELSARLTDGDRPRLLVDLSDLNTVTSGAMGMLVTIRKKFMHHGGQLHIHTPNAQIRGAFEVMQLQRLLMLFDDLDQARQFK